MSEPEYKGLGHAFYEETNAIAQQLRSRHKKAQIESGVQKANAAHLTAKNLDVVAFMRVFLAENDRLPAMKDIAENFGWASCNAAQEHTDKLMKFGVIERSGTCWYRFSRGTL